MNDYRKIWFQQDRTGTGTRTPGRVMHRGELTRCKVSDLLAYFPYAQAEMRYLCLTAPNTEHGATLDEVPERTLRVNPQPRQGGMKQVALEERTA